MDAYWRETRMDDYWRYVADGADDLAKVERACEEGKADACGAASDIHWFGIGVRRSKAEAESFARKQCVLDDETCRSGSGQNVDERRIAEERDGKCQAKPSPSDCYGAAMAYLRTGLNPKRGSALLDRACDLSRDELRAIDDAERARGRRPGLYENRVCDELGRVLVLGKYGVPRDVRRGSALLRAECDKGPAQAACSYLGLVSELGLGGEAKDVDAALARYMPACSLHTYFEASAAGHRDPKARLSDYTNEPLACYRLAVLSTRGRGVTRDPRAIGQLYAEGCIGDPDLHGLACAPAAALFLQQRMESQRPPIDGINLASTTPDPLHMAEAACYGGSVEGCRLLARIQHYADDHQLAFDGR